MYRVYRDLNGVVVKDEEIKSPQPVNDVLKISKCENVLIENCRIFGGAEDCIDQVQGRGVIIRSCRLIPQGKNGITMKGAIDGVELNDLLFETHGKECDVEFGQHTIYSSALGRDVTKNIRLINVRSLNGQPVKVKIWNATKPMVVGGNVEVVKIPTIIVKAYFLWRWVQIHWLKKVSRPN